MIYSFDDLALKYRDYSNIKSKINREVHSGKLIQITRGLYETDANVTGKYLAGRIFGPSYLSFDYALSLYGLIPEAVYKTYTSASFQKKKTKKFENQYGLFTYRDIPSDVYPLGALLFDDLRIDENEFKKLDMEVIEKLAPLYRANNLKFLIKFVRRMK